MKRLCAAAVAMLVFTSTVGAQTMFGVVGNQNPNRGAVVIHNQVTGSGVVLGTPVAATGLTGIDFLDVNTLFAATIQGGGSTSTLIKINPNTGALISTIGSITDGPGGPAMSIGDLAFQPGPSGPTTLFGIRSNADAAGLGGLLYTINTSSGVATFVGDTGAGAGGGIAFTPDGRLYQTSFNDHGDFPSLNEISPIDASRISTMQLDNYYDGLGIRQDGMMFASPGGTDQIFVVDQFGGTTLLGPSGVGNISDLAFRAIPEPATFALVGIGVGAAGSIIAYRRRFAAVAENDAAEPDPAENDEFEPADGALLETAAE